MMKENDAGELGERQSFDGWTEEDLERFVATGEKPARDVSEQEPTPGCPGCRVLAQEIRERDRHLAELTRRTPGGPDDDPGGQ